MLALSLFKEILALSIIMLMGFMLVKLKILKPTDSKILSVLCVSLITPCVNINAFQLEFAPEILKGFMMALLLSFIIQFCYFLLCGLFKTLFKLSAVERLSAVYSNAGNLVIPLVAAVFGGQWLIYANAYRSLQLFWQWTHANTVMSGQPKFDLKKALTNINLLSIIVGLAMFLAHYRLPAILASVTSSLSAMIGPTSMLMIGMMIGGADLKDVFFKNKRIYFIAFLKLIAVPLVALLILKVSALFLVFENKQTILAIVYLATITPVSATTSQLSQYYDNEVEYCGAINVVTTVLSLITMPLMMALI